MRFCGNEICCGSYACLNAIQNEKIDVQMFELSTTVPFGIRHIANEHFDRLLTTFCDPNQGLDKAFKLWGYQSEKLELDTAEQTIRAIEELFRSGVDRIVLGPIDMGHLGYQIMPQLLERMDHYITLRAGIDGIFLLTDSEGICDYPAMPKELEGWISVEDVPEAKGKITLRHIRQIQDFFPEEEILRVTCENAWNAFQRAESEGEGSQAVKRCCELLMNSSIHQWRLPFLYDLQYLQQRKWLTYQLFQRAQARKIFLTERLEEVKRIVKQQGILLGELYYELNRNNRLSPEKLLAIGREEQKLGELQPF